MSRTATLLKPQSDPDEKDKKPSRARGTSIHVDIIDFVEELSGNPRQNSVELKDPPPSGGQGTGLAEVEEPFDWKGTMATLVGRVGYYDAARELANYAPRVPPPAQISEADLAEFKAHAKAHPWDSESGKAPSAHIQFEFNKWFGRGLSLDHIAAVERDLVAEYKKEIIRNPRKRIRALTKPHKLPPGKSRATSRKLAAELSPEERTARCAKNKTHKVLSRGRQHRPGG